MGPLLFFYIYLLCDIVRSFNVQHRQYADDTNTMQIFISLSSTSYSADISNLTHSFTHSLCMYVCNVCIYLFSSKITQKTLMILSNSIVLNPDKSDVIIISTHQLSSYSSPGLEVGKRSTDMTLSLPFPGGGLA